MSEEAFATLAFGLLAFIPIVRELPQGFSPFPTLSGKSRYAFSM